MDARVSSVGLTVLVLCFSVWSQQRSDENLRPLLSTKEDVLRSLGRPDRTPRPNRLEYDLSGKTVAITLYGKGCSPFVERALGLVSGQILEVKTTLSYHRRISDHFSDLSGFQIFKEHGEQKFFYNEDHGIAATTNREGLNDNITGIFRFPPRSKLNPCLLPSFGTHSAIDEMHYFGLVQSEGDRFKYPPIAVGRYFDEDSEESRMEIVDAFVEVLLGRPNSVGYAIITSSVGEVSPKKKRTKLLTYLKSKGVDCSRIVLVEGGIGPLSGVSFSVMHESLSSHRSVCPKKRTTAIFSPQIVGEEN